MSELDVQIVQMEPMHVASAHGFGESPEELAWNKILAFAEAKGIDRETHPRAARTMVTSNG